MAQFAIENLTFSYPTDPEHPSLKNVTLHVEQENISPCAASPAAAKPRFCGI